MNNMCEICPLLETYTDNDLPDLTQHLPSFGFNFAFAVLHLKYDFQATAQEC